MTIIYDPDYYVDDGDDPGAIRIDYDHCMQSTDAAQLFKSDGEQYWIPDSQIEHHDKILKHFTIPEWLAEEKGLT